MKRATSAPSCSTNWQSGNPGKLPDHKATPAELQFERGQQAIREKIKALVEEHGLKNEAELWTPEKPKPPATVKTPEKPES